MSRTERSASALHNMLVVTVRDAAAADGAAMADWATACHDAADDADGAADAASTADAAADVAAADACCLPSADAA
eukprot:5378960-Prymnesium_polylepis.1